MTGWGQVIAGMKAVGDGLFAKVSSDQNRTIVLAMYDGCLVILKLWEQWRVAEEVQQVRRRLPTQQQQHSSKESSCQHDRGSSNGRKQHLRTEQMQTHGLWLLAWPCNRVAHSQVVSSSAFSTCAPAAAHPLLLQVQAEVEAGLAPWAGGSGGAVAPASVTVLPDLSVLSSSAYAGKDLEWAFKVSSRCSCSQDEQRNTQNLNSACMRHAVCCANPPFPASDRLDVVLCHCSGRTSAVTSTPLRGSGRGAWQPCCCSWRQFTHRCAGTAALQPLC
jgi:hypothetical protein